MESTTSFRYLAPATRIHAGVGILESLDREVQRLNAKRAFIVCSETLSKTSDLVEKVKGVLGERVVEVFAGAKRESPVPPVELGVMAAKATRPDIIVAVGGGSTVVTARAITIVLGEDKTIEEMYTKHYAGQAPVVYRALRPKVPNVVVLTTPTTATDRGGAAVWDEAPPHRKELYDPKTRPLATILDGEALLTSPRSLYLDTSLTTFSGLIGAAQSPMSPFAYADVRQALELSVKHLPRLLDAPEDPHPRIYLATAALLANRASQSTYGGSGRGRVTGMGRQLRYRYNHIGQGTAGCVMALLHLQTNRDIDPRGQAQLADLLGARRNGMSDNDAATAAYDYLVEVFRSVGAPTRLRDLGVPREDFDALAEAELAEPAFGEDSRRITGKAELVRMFEQGW